MSENKFQKIKRNIIGKFLYVPLISVYYWLIRLLRRRSIKLSATIIKTLNLFIRTQLEYAQQVGADKELDQNIDVATFKLLKPHYFDISMPKFFSKKHPFQKENILTKLLTGMKIIKVILMKL